MSSTARASCPGGSSPACSDLPTGRRRRPARVAGVAPRPDGGTRRTGGGKVRRKRAGSVGERFRAGDERALAEAFDAHAGPMTAVANHMLADFRLAEEAVQQAFVQAWRARAGFDPGRPLGPWLRSIVRRTAVDVW